MGENRRWQLTDLQRLLVVLAVVVAFFLAAMALGGSNLRLFLISAVLLIGAGLSVFGIGLRHNARQHELATAYVITVSPAPAGAIVGKCDMTLRVNLPGRVPVEVKFRDIAAPVIRWPRVSQTLPVDVELTNARHLRVRWDLIEQGYARAPDPTPPRSYTPARADTVRRDATPTVALHTQFADPSLNRYHEDPALGDDDATLRSPMPAVDPFATATAANGHDPDGYQSADFDRVRLDYADWADFDPAEVDRTDFGPDPQFELEAPSRTIPMPRPAEQPTLRITGPGTALPAGAGSTAAGEDGLAQDGASIGGMLIVSDLDRALRFYSETLGFTIVYATSGSAVVEYGGARILLQHMADFSGIDRRVGHLHIRVPDVEAAYRDLVAKGVAFSHRPKLASRSDDLELWTAAFRDPDGHGVAITEWRQRR